MRYYKMIVENIKTGERMTYTSRHPGAAPAGYKCISVCGYFEK